MVAALINAGLINAAQDKIGGVSSNDRSEVYGILTRMLRAEATVVTQADTDDWDVAEEEQGMDAPNDEERVAESVEPEWDDSESTEAEMEAVPQAEGAQPEEITMPDVTALSIPSPPPASRKRSQAAKSGLQRKRAKQAAAAQAPAPALVPVQATWAPAPAVPAPVQAPTAASAPVQATEPPLPEDAEFESQIAAMEVDAPVSTETWAAVVNMCAAAIERSKENRAKYVLSERIELQLTALQSACEGSTAELVQLVRGAKNGSLTRAQLDHGAELVQGALAGALLNRKLLEKAKNWKVKQSYSGAALRSILEFLAQSTA